MIRQNRPFLIGVSHNGPIVILPRDHIPWYRTQLAKDMISFEDLQKEKLHFQYNAMDLEMDIPLYVKLLRRILTPSYVASLPSVAEEVRRSLTLQLDSTESTWIRTPCLDLVESVIAAGAMRMAIGTSLSMFENMPWSVCT